MLKKIVLVSMLAATPLILGAPANANPYDDNARGTNVAQQGGFNESYGARAMATDRDGIDWGWLGLLGLIGLAGLRGRNRDAEPERH